MKWAKSFIGAGLAFFILGLIDFIFDGKVFPAGFIYGIPFMLTGIYLYYKAKKKEKKEQGIIAGSEEYGYMPESKNLGEANDGGIYYGVKK